MFVRRSTRARTVRARPRSIDGVYSAIVVGESDVGRCAADRLQRRPRHVELAARRRSVLDTAKRSDVVAYAVSPSAASKPEFLARPDVVHAAGARSKSRKTANLERDLP